MNRRDFLKTVAAGAALGGTSTSPAAAAAVPRGESGQQHFYDWSGTPYEIGVHHGRTLRDAIVKEAGPAVEELARTRKTSASRALDYVVGAYEPAFREHTPLALEEIRGIGEGSGLGYPYAFFAATRDGMEVEPARAEGCTAVTCGKPATDGGKVFIGQNKDTNSALERYRIMRLSYASGRKMMILNYPGWIANIGFTSDGVGFTGNSLFGQGPSGDILPISLLKRLILEKGSVSEFLAAIPRQPFRNGCILVADATGHQVCLEIMAGRITIRDVSGQAFGHANSVLTAEFRAFETVDGKNPSSPVRQRNVQQRLDAQRGRMTAERMKTVFADHADYPLCICRHRDRPGQDATTASFVANLTDREIEIAIGNPCTAPYQRYTL